MMTLSCYDISAQTDWIVQLTDSLINETDLCINCPQLTPQITSGISGGETVYFLRYGCEVASFFTQMRDVNGSIIGNCVVLPNADAQCTNSDVDILTIFTFIRNAQLIWSCDEGFICEFAEENGIRDSLRILVNDEQCAVGKKELYLAGSYQNYQWEGPNQSSIATVLEIDELGLYSVTTTDALGCSKQGELLISTLDSLTVNLFAPATVCEGDSFSIFTNRFETYEWSTGSIDSTISLQVPGEYSLTVSSGLGCIGSSRITINNIQGLDPRLTTDETTIEIGDTVQLLLTGVDAETIQLVDWSINTSERCNDCFITTVTPSETTKYAVDIIDNSGCRSTAALTINVNEKEIIVYVPNAVQLSGRVENQKFGIVGKPSIFIEQLDVFDRWGNVVFSRRKLQMGDESSFWNGRFNNSVVEEGVYTYRTLLRNLNGKESVFVGDFVLFH